MIAENEAVKRRPAVDVTFIGDLTGSYLLSSREKSGDGQRRLFGCRCRSVSAQLAVLQAPVNGQLGEQLALKLDTLGLLKARIVRLHGDGFAAELSVTDKEAAVLTGRIDWLKQRHLKLLPERREGKRWLPHDSRSSLILADRRQIGCLVMDVSTTGAAVSADVMPEIGHPLVVGAVLGRVVRRLDCGFAIKFLIPQPAERVEQMIAPVRENRANLLTEALQEAEAMYAASRIAAQAGDSAAVLNESESP